MQVQLHNDSQAGQYAAALLKIGEDCMPSDSNDMIILSHDFCQIIDSTDHLKNSVYPDLSINIGNREWLCERAILAPTNEIVKQINEQIMSDVEGDVVEYLSVENVMDTEQVTSYPIEFLNSLELSGVPSHKLRLKVDVPVLLMRNLDAPRLYNGTRLQITHLGRNIIKATIITGMAKRENVLIPRIPIIPTDLPFQFKRRQFPLKAAFAITINKAQGETLKVAGVHLEKKCFSHGQLFGLLRQRCLRTEYPHIAPEIAVFEISYSYLTGQALVTILGSRRSMDGAVVTSNSLVARLLVFLSKMSANGDTSAATGTRHPQTKERRSPPTTPRYHPLEPVLPRAAL
ncbi:hypothetical protein EVAR_103730_1 [Eumeta japonica]|uniref:DNA helicase Pif1-like 2B domain-containing protein n=1 Tax=Eumeta variegata TaxID=151549 RepID=A0A4C1ZIH0_EUMVA|nr:hypothetical protein EVAR_103730_1 [Eumeta japonica]